MTSTSVRVEAAHQALKLDGLAVQALGGGVGLFDHGCVLLGYLVHLVDRRIDLGERSGLFARSGDDRLDQVVDLANLFFDLAKRRAGFVDQRHAGANLRRGGFDQCLDFLGRIGRASGQFAHFLGDDGKSLAGFAGAGCLDTGIERQQVGLEGDVVDDRNDLADLLGGRFDLFHRRDGVLDHLAGFFCARLGGADHVAGFLGALRRTFHGRGDLVECCSCFFKRGCLLFGAFGQIVGSRPQFGR